MKKILLLLSLVMFTACARTNKNEQNADKNEQNKVIDTPLIAEAKVHVSQLLVNPSSATFQNVVQKKANVVCGEINGKNKNGEYTTFTPFYYQKKNNKVFTRVASENRLNRTLFNPMYRAHCK